MKKTLMLAVTAAAVAAAFGFPADAHVRADSTVVTLEQMQNELLDVGQRMTNITATADAEARNLTDDERNDFDKLSARFGELTEDIGRYERQAEVQATLQAGRGRQTQPNPASGNEPAVTPAANASRAQAAARPSVPAQPRENTAGSFGFRSFAEYTRAVVASSARGAQPDPRLIQNAPTTYGSEGVGADGGFAVPPDFRSTILQKIMAEESLLGRTDQLTTSSNSITFPTDSTAPWTPPAASVRTGNRKAARSPSPSPLWARPRSRPTRSWRWCP